MSLNATAFRQDEYAIEISPASENLSQKTVVDIYQDSNGFIWLLTQEGLNRFDGQEVVAFKTDRADPTSINNQATTTIAEDDQGRLWIGTLGGGLSRFNEADLSFTSYEALPSISSENPVSNMVSSLYKSGDGSLWVGYANGSGFSRFYPNEESFVHYFLPNQMPSAGIEGFVETENGTLFIAVDGSGVYRMDTETGVLVSLNGEIVEGATTLPTDISDMALLESGELLVTSKTKGAFLYAIKRKSVSRHPLHFATQADTANQIQTVMGDTDGNHWFGTESGIVVYSKSAGATWLTSVNTQLPSAAVLSLMQGRSGMLWIGTFSGLAQGTRSLFQKFTEEDGLSSSPTFSILTDEENNWWIGTQRGINSLQATKNSSDDWQLQRPILNLLGDYQIMSIEKHESMLYAGTYTAGFFEIDLASKTITQFTADGHDGSLSANGVPVLEALSDGRILVGTYGGGLNVFDQSTKTFQSFTTQSGIDTTISDDRVISILIDSREQIWVGTQDGLNLFDTETATFRRFKSDPDDTRTLSSNVVFSLAEDKESRLWIGTRGDINYLSLDSVEDDFPRFQLLAPSVGVPTSDILGLVIDEDDNLWAAHNLGLTKIDSSRQKSISFDISAGLQGREFNQGSAHAGENGTLFFGGFGGFNVVDSNINYEDNYEPEIQITSFKLLNEQVYFETPYSDLNDIYLDYDYQFASVSFSALDYRQPGTIDYRYRIDGIHNEWINLGQTRSVSISGLGYGTYKLRLSSTNSSGIWSNNDRELTLHIASPWWLTWYAFAAYAALIVYVILFIFRQQQAKSRRELARRLELEERVEERTHDLMLARNEAEAAARAKSEFLAAMSHEIRTPMHGMIGMTDLLIQSGLSAQQRSYAETARDSGESLLAIINSILDYSKMEANKLELDFSEFDVISLIDNVCTLLIQSASSHGTEVYIVWGDCQHRKVYGDVGKIRQILLNLIGNAIKFTKGGKVVIRCSTTAVSEDSSENTVRYQVAVEDNGIGIAKEKLDSVFEVFTQADTSTTRQYGGTGLGLSISKELAALMDGSLSVTSELNVGSTFTFETKLRAIDAEPERPQRGEEQTICVTENELIFKSISSKLSAIGYAAERFDSIESIRHQQLKPERLLIDRRQWESLTNCDGLAAPKLIVLWSDNKTPEPTGNTYFISPPFTESELLIATESSGERTIQIGNDEDKANGIKTNILVVEDVAVNQQIAMTMLHSLGAKVQLAGNGEEAVDLFQKSKYDLIFMDCQMPILDGYAATQRIRKIEQERGLPRTTIIALTAGGDQGDKQRALDAGMNGLLTKPFTTHDLRKALESFGVLSEMEASSTTSAQKNIGINQALVTQDEVLDTDVLTNFKRLSVDSEELIPKLIEGFSSQFTEKLKELETCIQNKDRENLRTVAHAIKSMSANMGAIEIRAAADELEKGYLQFRFEEDTQVIQDLKSHYLRYTIEVNSYLMG
ncbi:two-component regulator propeller domain-containing protein [Congregibacter litoralis]|uniref:two-component regulator propeller domain-containing protein n=1 Tax=Congregibacter litoralis TaxID=393662 RepID=UPI00146FA1D2|nr:two-component regulator propeller domain-containing protein [Congregibacter litoralis]